MILDRPFSDHGTDAAALALKPLGAGDLIDRAVRFYRQNFTKFLLIAAPPVVGGAFVSVLWMLLTNYLFPTGRGTDEIQVFSYALTLTTGTILILFFEAVATLAVMGGASRNFVRHLLFGEPISFRQTYRNAWLRLPSLVAAGALLIAFFLIVGVIMLYTGLIAIGIIVALLSYLFFSFAGYLGVPIIVVAAVVGVLFVLFLIMAVFSRFAYVPQVMLVEGTGFFTALGRSVTLAKGNVKRFTALVSFSVLVTYSALAVLYIPLMWYGAVSGVDLFGDAADGLPMWYQIATQLITQASLIVLTPVWMIGLCLLYVDERVRHEGYDIELLAARRLGEIPDVPDDYVNPLQPAISSSISVPEPKRPSPMISPSAPSSKSGRSGSIFNLDQ